MAGKIKEANEVEAKMTSYKNDNYDAMTMPRAFFCTFHQEHAYVQAIFTNEMEF